MHQSARLLAAGILSAAAFAATASAQISIQPTPAPAISAEHEPWYENGEPIVFGGALYYRAGPSIHFLANEMVQSALYKGIPLYSRTTIEPYSVVFVPIGGGLMQPYERPRAGDLAGTSGSSVSALPVEMASSSTGPATAMLQAPAPPIVGSAAPVELSSGPDQADRGVAGGQPAASSVGTSGRVASSPKLRIRTDAANGIFVEFNDQRWFSSGPPVARDSRTLRQIGEYRGFPVYAAARQSDSTIYIPVARGVDALAPFSKRK
jgi:hypothetical protein